VFGGRIAFVDDYDCTSRTFSQDATSGSTPAAPLEAAARKAAT
jgi:hypothetical protein